MELSLGELIDRLSIVNVKVFKLVEFIETGKDDPEVADAARKVQALNRQRSDLKNEIDRMFSGGGRPEIKV